MADFEKKQLTIERKRKKQLREKRDAYEERSLELEDARNRVRNEADNRENKAFEAYKKDVRRNKGNNLTSLEKDHLLDDGVKGIESNDQ